ncbi:hypothetical protein U1Q18_051582 [Sarracenia purpurea var. burkii]
MLLATARRHRLCRCTVVAPRLSTTRSTRSRMALRRRRCRRAPCAGRRLAGLRQHLVERRPETQAAAGLGQLVPTVDDVGRRRADLGGILEALDALSKGERAPFYYDEAVRCTYEELSQMSHQLVGKPLCFEHDRSRPVGTIVDNWVDAASNLHISAYIPRLSAWHDEVIAGIDAKRIYSLSVGYDRTGRRDQR